ncbi:MAG: Tm-1-like ATP-binding domain-containing protein [Pseudomonadota bacterium]
MGASVLLLATLETKGDEADYLTERLRGHGVTTIPVDVSLQSRGVALGGADKASAMEAAAARGIETVAQALSEGVHAVVGIGGGTGGQVILKILRSLPITFPKVLITTMPFDPRYVMADNSIVMVPTLADICGLNATLREVLENAAAMTAGLCQTRRVAAACVTKPSIGITALGATDRAVAPLVEDLRQRGREATVIHANGFGGAAFARFARRGAFEVIIDLTPHELTRIHIAGSYVPMPERFTAAPGTPRIVLPGALNFIGLGERRLLPDDFVSRPHYQHSGFFTHVKLTEVEMDLVTQKLADALNHAGGPRTLIVPMGGFSHEDGPDGAIEDPQLRDVFLDAAREHLSPDVKVVVMKEHLFDVAVRAKIHSELATMTANRKVTA